MQDESDGSDEDSGWTDAKLTALKYVSFLPGLLSILGSSCLIYHVLSSNPDKRTSKHHLLLGLSVSDISSSFWITFGAALVPRTSRAFCQTQGFFAQLANITTFYTAFLSVYFFLRVRYNVPETRLKQRYEPWFHATSLLYPLFTALACLPLDLYNPVLIGCHIEAYPQGCNRKSDETCERGGNALLFYWIFTMAPIFMVMGTVLVCQLLIYWTVRQQLRANLRYGVVDGGPQQQQAQLRPTEQRMLRSVAEQSLSYVAAFLTAFLLPTVASFIELLHYGGLSDPKFFPLFLLILFLYPLQGFLNCLVYLRPNYLALRKEVNGVKRSRWSCLWLTLSTPASSTRKRRALAPREPVQPPTQSCSRTDIPPEC